MNFSEIRRQKAKNIDAEITRIRKNQSRRLKSVGEVSNTLDSQIKELTALRQTLPVIQNTEDYTFPVENGRYFRPTAGMSGIYNDERDVAFWAGSDLSGAIWTAMNPFLFNPPQDQTVAPFVVTHGGIVIANQAIIRGNIYATDGVFNGTVYATDGKFTGEVNATSGTFNGKITSNTEGNRIEINPIERSLTFTNHEGQRVIQQDFFINSGYSGGRIRINLVDQVTGGDYCYCEIDGGKIAVYGEGDTYFFRADAYQKKIWIDAESLPQGRNNAYPTEVYMDGETMKIKRGE